MMDYLDQQIIALLKTNSRRTVTSISQAINLSQPATAERITKLKRTGIIQNYTITLATGYLEKNIEVYIWLQSDHCDWLLNHFNKYDNILMIKRISGEQTFLLQMVVKDLNEFEQFRQTLHHRATANFFVVTSSEK